jgi:acetyl-CoA synthetase (ADP-forming)
MATLLGAEGYKLLEKYNLPVAPFAVVRSKFELDKFSKHNGFPLVIKAISPKIIHKTEAKAVHIVKNAEEAEKAFALLQTLGYVLAQKFVPGTEVIIGEKQDGTFGKVVLFGGGGILVELIKDVSFRVCPITKEDAMEMINEVKIARVLRGFRGQKPANTKALAELLLKVCVLAEKENIQELDLNPVIVNDKSATIVDVRIVI